MALAARDIWYYRFGWANGWTLSGLLLDVGAWWSVVCFAVAAISSGLVADHWVGDLSRTRSWSVLSGCSPGTRLQAWLRTFAVSSGAPGVLCVVLEFLAGFLFGGLISCLAGWLVIWLSDWPGGLLSGCLVGYLAAWLVAWLAGWLND